MGDGEGLTGELIFFDGRCGLCHGAVRFVLARGPRGRAFRFAPLGGATFQHEIPETRRRDLPDSLVVKTKEGRLLTRSDAVVRILRSLGGGWAVLGALLWVVPKPLRDLGYRAVAAIRGRLLPLPPGACPWRTAAQQARFED